VAKFYGYIRAQVDPARKGSKSLQAQRCAMDAFAEHRSLSFEKIFCDEGELTTESIADRKAGRLLLNVLQRDDTVVTPSLDRLFLGLDDAQSVIQSFLEDRIQLLPVDFGTAVEYSQLLALLPAIRAAELERHSLHIRRGKKKRKVEGGLTGGTIPYGYAKAQWPETGLTEVPQEQKKIREARELRRKKMSFRNIARRLSRRGRSISHVTVRRILLEPEE
jgi:DNA invertase Pin-like site-specific DNA recombinase